MGLSVIFSVILDSFMDWLSIFILPFTKLSTIWIIIPIWLSWFFAEFFQEKDGTSFGNAISNGAVPIWVGIDWIRQLTNQIVVEHAKFSGLFFTKYAVSILAIVFGLIIVIAGIKGKNYIKYLGRIRVVTYLLAFFTPLIYGLIKPNLSFFIELIVYFPLFYFLIELIDKYTPRPKVVAMDQGLDKEKDAKENLKDPYSNLFPKNNSVSGSFNNFSSNSNKLPINTTNNFYPNYNSNTQYQSNINNSSQSKPRISQNNYNSQNIRK